VRSQDSQVCKTLKKATGKDARVRLTVARQGNHQVKGRGEQMMKAQPNKTRRHYEKVFGHLYTFKGMDNRLSCAYCGDTRATVDHIPPISLVAKIGTKELRKRDVELITVPACKTCNATLAARPLATYEERLVFMYNKTIDQMESKTFWSDDEMNELGGRLKQMVVAKQMHLRRELTERLRGMERNLAKMASGVEE
jgi:hypothetical protein